MRGYKPIQIIDMHPHSMKRSGWGKAYHNYVDVEELLEQKDDFLGLCEYCDVELVGPIHGDPLEPANPYCPQCGWIEGEGEESRYNEYQ